MSELEYGVAADTAPADPAPNPVVEAALKKTRKQDPQRTIDEFWAKFTTKAPGQAYTVLPNDLYAKRAARTAPKGIVPGHNAAASFDEAVATCRAKVQKIAKECRRVNQKYRDVHFDIEIDLKLRTLYCLEGLLGESSSPPASVKRVGDIFEAPMFFVDGISADDVKQGRDGDCWFLAALCTLSNVEDLISKICVARDEAVGVYGFVFNRDGEWISTIIDDKLYLLKPDYDDPTYDRLEWDEQRRADGEEKYRKTKQTGSEALYFAQCSDENETWLPLLEKAYAKAHGDFSAIDGGFVGEAIEDLTGGVTTELFTTDILDKEKFWTEELMHVNEDFLFGCFTGLFGGWGERKGIIEGHAYSVMKAVEVDGLKLVLLKNPWGDTEWTGPWSDGSKEWTPYWMEKLGHRFGDDGAFWISYDDLLRKYQHFDRTRLFRAGDNWVITHQWTSLNVPWSVDYQNTKFMVTTAKSGPVVIILSQLDNRYFKGLEGQYDFQLQFRLHKEGDEDYIVRSHGGYLMTRSVSVEIDLEPGRYSVLVKVIATRNTDKPRVEDVVRKTCKDKRDKLLQIGLSYDLAHAKGHTVETESERKKRDAAEAKKKEKEKRRKEREASKKAKAKAKRQRERQKKKEKREKARKEKQKAREENKKAAAEAEKAPRGDDATKDIAATDKKAEADTSKAEETLDDAKAEEKTGDAKAEDTKDAATQVKAAEADLPKVEPTAKKDEAKTKITEEKKDAKTETATDDTVADKKDDVVEDKKQGAKAETKDEDTQTEAKAEEPRAPTDEPSEKKDEEEETEEEEEEDDDDEETESEGEEKKEEDKKDEAEDDEDEFSSDPWNACLILGLRVYSRDEGVTIEVVKPKMKGEDRLDLDDSGRQDKMKTERSDSLSV